MRDFGGKWLNQPVSCTSNLEVFITDKVEFRDNCGVILEGVVQVVGGGSAGRCIVWVFEHGAVLVGVDVAAVIGL